MELTKLGQLAVGAGALSAEQLDPALGRADRIFGAVRDASDLDVLMGAVATHPNQEAMLALVGMFLEHRVIEGFDARLGRRVIGWMLNDSSESGPWRAERREGLVARVAAFPEHDEAGVVTEAAPQTADESSFPQRVGRLVRAVGALSEAQVSAAKEVAPTVDAQMDTGADLDVLLDVAEAQPDKRAALALSLSYLLLG